MKNITLRADKGLIEKARRVARSQRKTLNTAFRESENGEKFDLLMRRLRHIKADRHFGRTEMNER